MKVILPFILNGQTLEKGMNFPKSVVSGSKDTLVVKVEGIPEGQNAVAYFSLSWENGKTYNLVFNGDECTIHEYITTLPKATNDFIEYYVTMSVAIFDDTGKRLTTKPVKLVLHKSNYSETADNTPEIPQSQFDAIVEIFNKKVAELSGGDIYLSKDEANYQLLKGYIDAGKTVIIKDDSGYLYLSAYDDDYISFYTIAGGNYGYVDYYSSGAVDEYWSPRTINEEDVQHDYDANSNKPISGAGVAKALETVGGGSNGGNWQKVVDITTTKEVSTIFATAVEFPNLSKCKEFLMRAIYPKLDGTTTIKLGTVRVDINGVLCFHSSSANISYATETEHRAHIIFVDNLVHTVATKESCGHASIKGDASILVGNRFVTGDVSEFKFWQNDETKSFPIGTQLVIYGKAVE